MLTCAPLLIADGCQAVTSKDALVELLPTELDDNLKKLVVSVIAKNLKSWREQSSSNQLSLPQLRDFDWRIDIKTSAGKFECNAVCARSV